MRARDCVRVLALVAAAATAAGCSMYPYGSSKYDYGPGFDKVPGYQPGYGHDSQWDYYRNYRGAVKPPADQIN